ncbi:hypothetical protein C2S51_009628 [Perilla frutescens var. frutescens]|nr:hypothetical protein C2S51_009628 [Perilla frutescens var. frutescens]
MSETTTTTHRKAHAIVFPYPYQGHITPTINLAAKLASNGFTVTYVQLEFIGAGGAATLGIRCATISDGFPLEFDRNANFTKYWESMILDFPARVDELVGRIKKSDESATGFFLVADSLYTWTADIATKHNLVNVSLWTAPALVFSIGYHLDLLKQNGHFPFKGSSDDLHINYIPGVESITRKDLMSQIQKPHAIPILIKIMEMSFEQVKKADFILCNTVQELESHCLSSLDRRQPTYAVGPINFFAKTASLLPTTDCSVWLESKPPASVLYISFGSIFEFNKQDITEIAHALVSTGVDFLWVLKTEKKESNLAGVFPDGFLDRGLVVPWCDQRAVLSSPAVGGFLTHCGWNSTVESMWNGVPMLCYPFCVDQPTNRKLVVENWRVGIDLCDGEQVITREEVSRKIDGLMKGNTCVELRQEVKKVSHTVRNALERDGSSQINFDRFVHDLKGRLKKME